LAVPDSDFARHLSRHHEAVGRFVECAQRLDDVAWRARAAASGWCPGQVAEHIALTYATLVGLGLFCALVAVTHRTAHALQVRRGEPDRPRPDGDRGWLLAGGVLLVDAALGFVALTATAGGMLSPVAFVLKRDSGSDPEVVVVTSCSKNLGLYRERVGAASFVSATAEASKLVLANASNVARGIYSMPPDHGAAIVSFRYQGPLGEIELIDNPADLPPTQNIDFIEEPFFRVSIISPKDYTGTLMELCQSRRGELSKLEYLSPERVELHYLIPLAEVVVDFFDQMKSRTQGYASLDYELAGYQRYLPVAGNCRTCMVEIEGPKGNMLTIATQRRLTKLDYGVLQVDNSGRIRGFTEKPEILSTVSMGIYILEPAALEYVPPDRHFDFPDLVKALFEHDHSVDGGQTVRYRPGGGRRYCLESFFRRRPDRHWAWADHAAGLCQQTGSHSDCFGHPVPGREDFRC
jgi:hypothetical protein